MNGFSDDQGRFDLPGFWRWLEDLEEAGPDESSCAELAALLDRSPAARRAYLEYFQQSSVLRMEAAKLHERGLLPVAGAADQTRRAFQRSVLVAAALVALAAVVAALIAVNRPEPARLEAVVAAETRWSIDGVEQRSGNDPVSVAEGSTLRVLSGTVRLELESGGLLVVQGPAEVSFPKPHRPQIRRGWLWIDAENSSEPFVVEARGLRIRDIGTRFGVRVADNGRVEVQLVSGRVEVLAADGREILADLGEEGTAFEFPDKGGKTAIPPATDPFPSLPALLRQSANYRTTVLGQSPVGYWPLDEAADRNLANLIDGSSVGETGLAVRDGEPGVGAADGFPGLPDDGRSLFLDGSRDRSVVFEIDGLHGVNRREGAVSFWIRRPADAPPRAEVLWLAGSGDDGERMPSQAILHTYLNASGRVGLEIEDDGDHVTLSSSHSVADGRWHQIVASWGPVSADLFIDGSRAARVRMPEDSEHDSFRGRYVRFGKPSLELRGKRHPFTGWVDEITLWDRPLSPVEVQVLYESALGSASNDSR